MGLVGGGALRCGGFPIEIRGNVRKSKGESAQMCGGSFGKKRVKFGENGHEGAGEWRGLCMGCRANVGEQGAVASQEQVRSRGNVRGSVDKRASFHRERRAKWDRCGLVGWMDASGAVVGE